LWVGFGLFSKRARLALPKGAWRIIGAVSLSTLFIGLVILLYTPLGAYLVAGIWPYFPTIDYLPRGARVVSVAGLCLFFLVIMLTCVRKQEETTTVAQSQ
ncbi:MAG: hypothetical protein AAF512_05875, partial [Pseudomonadota bacterium]